MNEVLENAGDVMSTDVSIDATERNEESAEMGVGEEQVADNAAGITAEEPTAEPAAVDLEADAVDALLRTHYDRMRAQAAEMKRLYPEFDLKRELRDPNFFRWTTPEGGMTLKQAYMALHGDEILAAGMRYAVEQSRMKTVASIRGAQSRPREGGLDAVAGATLRTDPAALSGKERAELRKRVSRGERIVF